MKYLQTILSRNAILFILFLHLILVSINVNEHWIGADAFNGALFSNIAHNYVEYGFLKTKFGQVTNYEYQVAQDGMQFHYYQHHPPLFPWLLGVTFKILGEGEAQARFLPIMFSALSLILLYKLMNLLYGKKVAILASFIYAILPITAFYGHHPTHEPLATTFIIAIVLMYSRWVHRPDKKNFLLLTFVYTIAMLTAWPVYLLAGLIPAHHLLIKRKLDKTWVFLVISIAVFCFHFLHSFWLQPGSFQDAFKFLLAYSGVLSHEQFKQIQLSTPFTTSQYLYVVGNKMSLLFTIPALVAAIFGIAPLWKNIKEGDIHRETAGLLLIVIIQSITWNSIFWVQHFNTNNWLYYFATPVSMLSALAIDSFSKDRLSDIPNLSNPVIVFICATIFISSFVNFKKIHTQQQMLLPAPQRYLEVADFVPRLAAFVRKNTEPTDVVITNLPFGQAVEAFTYYSQRMIVWGISGGGTFEKAAAELKPSQHIFVLLWPAQDEQFMRYFGEISPEREHNIAGHKFLFFNFIRQL